jgi:hypothetical protein
MGFLMLGAAIMHSPILILIPALLAVFSLAVIEANNEEYGAI